MSVGGRPRGSSRSQPSNFTLADRCFVSNNYLPNKKRRFAQVRSKTFCSQYANEGKTLITASQDHMIRFYRKKGDRYQQFNEIQARDVGWSILDVAVSPDGRHLIYGTWSDYIHECSIYGDNWDLERFEAYNLDSREYRFCVFSVRFSSDGSEILAGASDGRLYVYSRDEKRLKLTIDAHEDDVNTVCFGDETSRIIYSGSDDGVVKVWDRRSLAETSPAPVGVLAGHTDGITFIDSKGDGRYLISNCKDQSVKLWDVRKFSGQDALNETRNAVARQNWDYRWQAVPRKARKVRKLEGDTSVMTYRGHTVLHTLLRAYFSPAFTTGQRYIYACCAGGRVIIYDLLSGEIVKKMDGHQSVVRDANWHPYENEIVTSSWDGRTFAWYYNERKTRNINPEAKNNADEGDEDTSDEEGIPRSGSQRRRAGGRCRRGRSRSQSGRSERVRDLIRRKRQAAEEAPPCTAQRARQQGSTNNNEEREEAGASESDENNRLEETRLDFGQLRSGRVVRRSRSCSRSDSDGELENNYRDP